MQFVFAIHVMSVVMVFQLDATLAGCVTANWASSFDHPGWSVCPNSNTYLKGLWRNARAPGDERIGRLEFGKCCPASEPAYDNQPATCKNADWVSTLDGFNVWAVCPNGYFLNGFRVSNGKRLPNIEEAKCCRPQNQPEDSYEDCYDEDVSRSFDVKGWSECKRDGYYMTGLYKSTCNNLYCIEKFKCCRMKSAAIDGGWSEFGEWSECSTTCGDGQQARTRTCTNPPPSNGGAQCSGADKETRSCNNGPCVVDGSWSAFGDWSECSVTCGGGIRERRRTCTSPPPSNGGECCVGDNVMAERCNIEPCEVEGVDGGWSEWSAYSECKGKKNCGKGRMTRTRTCTNPPPSGGGKDCNGKSKQTKKCKLESCKGRLF